jgi:hypothetical protein
MENQEQHTSSHESRSLDADKLKGKGKAVEVAEQLKARGKDQLEAGKKTAAEGVEQLAEALEEATESLQQGEQQSLAGYVHKLAGSVRSLAATLHDSSLDELLGETQELARRNPTLFFFGSVAAGIAVSRFIKASGERENSQFPDNMSGVARRVSDQQTTDESLRSIQPVSNDNEQKGV